MRTPLYFALVGVAGLLLLPLRGGWATAPAWAESRAPVIAREGLYTQRLGPGEARTYLLELAAGGLLKIRFCGAGLGLRLEDGEGRPLGTGLEARVGPSGERRLGVVNPAATAQTLYLTVTRAGTPTVRRPLPATGDGHRGGARGDLLVVGGADGGYALEVSRGALP